MGCEALSSRLQPLPLFFADAAVYGTVVNSAALCRLSLCRVAQALPLPSCADIDLACQCAMQATLALTMR